MLCEKKLYTFLHGDIFIISDPNKPPPITNYMSVKIETLMSCLEKMYHNHLPLNAFTSRFPNARAKAMLTLMLDGHRQDCEKCDTILDDANVSIVKVVQGIEKNLLQIFEFLGGCFSW